jgi:hypothetical protein
LFQLKFSLNNTHLRVLTGWWGLSEATEFAAFNPLVETADVVWNTLVGWMFIPFGAYSALKVSTYFTNMI